MKNQARPSYAEIHDCLANFECSHPLDLEDILNDWDKADPKPVKLSHFVWEWLENNIDSQSYSCH